MQKAFYYWIVIQLLIICSNHAFAERWFTGAIIANSGKIIGKGHWNFEQFVFITENNDDYDNQWRLTERHKSRNIQINPLFIYGFSKNFDVEVSTPYDINYNQGKKLTHIGDVSVLLGYQVLTQRTSIWCPDLRISVQEIFPTGKFEDINPTNAGTDGTGVGSYQTSIGLNFQHLIRTNYSIYFRNHMTFNYVIAQPVVIDGTSVLGGNKNTRGVFKTGNLISFDLASEISFTKNWVAIIETFYFNRSPSPFEGFTGLNAMGIPFKLSAGQTVAMTLAPGLEYNFSKHYGIIAAGWWALAGKNTPNFRTAVLALNIYW